MYYEHLMLLWFSLCAKSEVSVTRIEEILNSESEIQDREDAFLPEQFRGEICFEHVTYSYAPDNEQVEPVLKDISFCAQPGKTTAIIGSTGCGKSTLLNLIPRLYDVTEGSITLDGVDIRTISQKKLRDAIGYVPQKAVLFSGDIRSNIKLCGWDDFGCRMEEAAATATGKQNLSKEKESIELERYDRRFPDQESGGGLAPIGGYICEEAIWSSSVHTDLQHQGLEKK